MDYVRLFRLIMRQKWLLLLVMTVATAGTWVGIRMKGRAYQATATLMPQEHALRAIGKDPLGLAHDLSDPQETPNDQVDHTRVESLVALMVSPRILGQLGMRLSVHIPSADLERMIKVEQVTPEVLRIRATANNPDLAAEIANGLASTFVQFYGDLSTGEISESIRLLQQQEKQAGVDLEHSKVAVQQYKSRHGIASLSEQQTGALSRLSAVNQQREAAKAQLADTDAQLQQARVQLARTPAIIRVTEKSNDSPAAQELRLEIAALEKDLALERGTHTEMHPTVRALKAKLATLNARLQQEQGQMVEHVRQIENPDYDSLSHKCRDLQTAHDGLAAQLVAFSKTIARFQKELDSYAGEDVQLAGLMQRYNIAEQRYSSLLSRLRVAEANADSIRRSSAIAIVDTTGPLNPPVDISLRTAEKLTAAAFFLSLALTVFLLSAWDFLDRRVKTGADAEALVELPVAGIVPRALPRPASSPLPQLAALAPASPETEAYRFLSLHLLLSRGENPVRVLMAATARPGQGATTMLSNLAVTLAQGNCRVILVDADLRRPALHNRFELPNEVGLTTVLTEGLPVERALQSTLLPNLALLSAGPGVENPWALLRSTAMEGLVRRLRQMADFVLIDTPSAAAFADAFNIAPLVDGVFLVVRSRYQPNGMELKIKEMFEEADVKVFGTVLNDVPIGSVDSCRYHQQYFSGSSRPSGRAPAAALPAGRR